MKHQDNNAEYPLYNVCCKTNEGVERVISREVTLRKAMKAMKRYDGLKQCHSPLIANILSCYLTPLWEKKPYYDETTGLFRY